MDDKNKTAKLVRVPKFAEVPFPVVMEPNLVIENIIQDNIKTFNSITNKRKYFKKFTSIFLIFFVITGIHLSINTGITHDEFHDYNVWQ